MRREGVDEIQIQRLLFKLDDETQPNWWIFGGSLAFVAFTLGVGLSNVTYAQEIVFAGSMAIVIFLMQRLIRELDPSLRKALVGTALIIFVFRAVPLPGPGATLVRDRRARLRPTVHLRPDADYLGPGARSAWWFFAR